MCKLRTFESKEIKPHQIIFNGHENNDIVIGSDSDDNQAEIAWRMFLISIPVPVSNKLNRLRAKWPMEQALTLQFL